MNGPPMNGPPMNGPMDQINERVEWSGVDDLACGAQPYPARARGSISISGSGGGRRSRTETRGQGGRLFTHLFARLKGLTEVKYVFFNWR